MTMLNKSHGKILFKLLGVLAALFFIGTGLKERSATTNIQKQGKLATVAPVTNYTEFKKGGFSTYTAEIHFTTEDGQEVVQKHSFPKDALADFKAGKPVQVVYLPSEPHTFVFASEKAGWGLVIGGALLLVAALMFA